jgi:indole-3-glycerol phosphate synthase
MSTTTVLDAIVAAHRASAVADERDLDELRRAARLAPPARGFAAGLAARRRGVIAEIKRRSPSAGPLAPDLRPSDLARRYEEAGAAALSVLTDSDYFGGSPADLRAARGACGLPVLRKDFTVSAADVLDARVMGADAVLLIAAALSDDELARFHTSAVELGMDALVEVHSATELERALAVGAILVGVNCRDLHTFEIDRDLPRRLADRIPDTVVAVAESGVREAADAAALWACGYHAVLVGESLVTAADPGAALAALRGEP